MLSETLPQSAEHHPQADAYSANSDLNLNLVYVYDQSWEDSFQGLPLYISVREIQK